MREGERTPSGRVIKDMRGDRDGLARTPVKVLMVAGHAAFPFLCVCVCVRVMGRDLGGVRKHCVQSYTTSRRRWCPR